MLELSLIICSHNPREEYLRRALESIKNQSLHHKTWELLVIDNASILPIEGRFDVSWHSNAKIISEPETGLTSARLRGIEESSGKILLFVDDDNLLKNDYLENALKIASEYLFLGAWGGSIEAEYEKQPPDWFKQFEGNIAVRTINKVCWGNDYFNYAITPVGAGMCLRREVAQAYLVRTRTNKLAMNLDRKGDSLMSCGDHDMAWTSIAMNLGVGIFPSLQLVHIIPPDRLAISYILRLMEADECSTIILRNQLLDEPPPPLTFWKRHPRLRKVGHTVLIRLGFRNRLDVQVSTARLHGRRRASKLIANKKGF